MMKIAGLLGSTEVKDGLNSFLNQCNIQITYDMENILGNVSSVLNHTDIEAVIIYEAARPKEQHKKLLYSVRSILPGVLLIWLCKDKEKDVQFEEWAFSAVSLKNILYINDNGEIPINRLVDALTEEHERLKAIAEAKRLKAEGENKTLREKPSRERIVEKVVEKPVIVEKEVIINRPTVVKGLLKIATFSVSPGAGSTTMAIRLAEQLSRFGRTAVVEVDKSGSIQHAKAIPNCEYRVLKDSDDPGDALYELYKTGFNITVTDYGCLFKIRADGTIDEADENAVDRVLLKEFIKADVKVGMAFTAPWQLGKLKFFERGNMVFEGLCGKAYEELCFLTDEENWEKADNLLGGIKCFQRNVNMDGLVELLLPDIASPRKKQHAIFKFLPKIQGVINR